MINDFNFLKEKKDIITDFNLKLTEFSRKYNIEIININLIPLSGLLPDSKNKWVRINDFDITETK